MKFSQIQLHLGRKKLERVCAALNRHFRFGQLTTNQHRVSVALAWQMTDDPDRPMELYEPDLCYNEHDCLPHASHPTASLALFGMHEHLHRLSVNGTGYK